MIFPAYSEHYTVCSLLSVEKMYSTVSQRFARLRLVMLNFSKKYEISGAIRNPAAMVCHVRRQLVLLRKKENGCSRD